MWSDGSKIWLVHCGLLWKHRVLVEYGNPMRGLNYRASNCGHERGVRRPLKTHRLWLVVSTRIGNSCIIFDIKVAHGTSSAGSAQISSAKSLNLRFDDVRHWRTALEFNRRFQSGCTVDCDYAFSFPKRLWKLRLLTGHVAKHTLCGLECSHSGFVYRFAGV